MNRPSLAPIGEDATYNRSDDRQDPRGHCKARARWPRSRSQGDRPCAPRCGHGGHLHGPASDPRADRRNGRPGGRGRHRHLDPLGRAHDARPAHSRAVARTRAPTTCWCSSEGRFPARTPRRCARRVSVRSSLPGRLRRPSSTTCKSTRSPGDVDRRQHARPRLGRDREPPGRAQRALHRAARGAARGLPRTGRRRRVRSRRAHGRRRSRLHRGRRHRRAGHEDAADGAQVLRARAGSLAPARDDAQADDRRRQWLCAGRRLRDGAGLRPALRLDDGALRPARDQPRHHSRAGAARSAWRARRRSASPRSSCSRVAWSRPTRRSIAGS